MGHTLRNLDEAEDRAAGRGMAEIGEARFARGELLPAFGKD